MWRIAHFLFVFAIVTTVFATPNQSVIYLNQQNITSNELSEPTVHLRTRSDFSAEIEISIEGFIVEHNENGLSIRLGDQNESKPAIGHSDISSLTVFLPFHYPIQGSVQDIVTATTTYRETDLGGTIRTVADQSFPTSSNLDNIEIRPWVELGAPGVFRDFGVLPIVIHPIRKTANDVVEVAETISFRIDAQPTGPMFTKPILASWEGLYRTMFLGYDNFSLGRSKLWRPGSYLVLYSDPNLVSLMGSFATMKRLEGYDVVVQQITTGSTPTSIRNTILQVFNSAPIPLEYVLLVGDADRGTYAIATNAFTSLPPFTETVSSDQNYTTLAGSDFWPDILIGRATGGNSSQMAVVVNKNIRYQNYPGRNTTNQQMTRALCFAGNYSDTGIPPITPTQNSRWAADMFRDRGYSVNEIYYPPTYPGTSEIQTQINQGLSVITYRGWGDSQGPLYPRLRVDDLSGVTANSLIPFVSIVCQTGAFGPGTSPVPNQRCFGEVWTELGTVSDMKGGPVFFGASHLHTNTRYNNPMLAGFMEGWITENLEKFGLIALRSKLEVFRGFPLEATSSEAYFNYYNILGDPSVTLWQLLPDSLRIEFPTTISANSGQVVIRALDGSTGQPQRNLVAALTAPNSVHSVAVTDANGYATLSFRANVGDSIRIAVRGRNYRPQFLNTVAGGNDNVAFRVDSIRVIDGGNSLLDFGETATLQVFVKNISSSAASGSATLSTLSSQRIAIVNNSSNAGSIAANGTGILSFTLTGTPSSTVGDIPMRLTFPSGTRNFSLPIGWIVPVIASYQVTSGTLAPGGTATIQTTIKNEGIGRIPSGTVQFYTFSNGGTITNGSVPLSSIGQHQTTTASFTISIPSNQISGHIIPIRVNFSHPSVTDYALANFNIIAGSRPVTQPTGPDNYGYYAYENIDSQYPTSPTYNWIELDPDSGGLGTHVRLNDDHTVNIPLPFNFRYYGTNYQTNGISICSNGWVSFQNTWQTDFYNWPMPNAQGANAMIAVNWDDLKGLAADTGRVSVWYYYNTSTQDFIIQWGRMYSRYGIETNPVPQRFQLILHGNRFGPSGDNEFTMQFQTASDVDVNNNYSTVGIMDWSHLDGLEVTYARLPTPGSDTLRSNRAIRFSTATPDNFVGVEGENPSLPVAFEVSEPYPNPFNSMTSIQLNIRERGFLSAEVYDIQGRLISTVYRGEITAGIHTMNWEASGQSAGIYFLRVQHQTQTKQFKLVYLK